MSNISLVETLSIKTVASNQEIECNYYLSGESELEVTFDPANVIVPAGTVRDIYGSVFAPRNLELETYEENFCIVFLSYCNFY